MPNFPMPGPSPASSSAKPQDGIFSKDIDKVDDEYADFMKVSRCGVFVNLYSFLLYF